MCERRLFFRRCKTVFFSDQIPLFSCLQSMLGSRDSEIAVIVHDTQFKVWCSSGWTCLFWT